MAGLARYRACDRCTHRADADTHRDRFGNQTFPDRRRRIRLRRPVVGRRPRLSRWIYLPERCRCRWPLTKQSSRPSSTGAMPLPNLSLWFYVSFQILSYSEAIVSSWRFAKDPVLERISFLACHRGRALWFDLLQEVLGSPARRKDIGCYASLTWQE